MYIYVYMYMGVWVGMDGWVGVRTCVHACVRACVLVSLFVCVNVCVCVHLFIRLSFGAGGRLQRYGASASDGKRAKIPGPLRARLDAQSLVHAQRSPGI